MRQFIPFEDDWDALANRRPEDLVPYNVGMFSKAEIRAPVMPAMIDQRVGGECEERQSANTGEHH